MSSPKVDPAPQLYVLKNLGLLALLDVQKKR